MPNQFMTVRDFIAVLQKVDPESFVFIGKLDEKGFPSHADMVRSVDLIDPEEGSRFSAVVVWPDLAHSGLIFTEEPYRPSSVWIHTD
jgi:hypothetical protein